MQGKTAKYKIQSKQQEVIREIITPVSDDYGVDIHGSVINTKKKKRLSKKARRAMRREQHIM